MKSVVKFPTLGKRKPNFVIGLIITKVNRERLQRVIGKFFRNYVTLTIVLMATAALKMECKAHAQRKERETFWQHTLKNFHPIGLNEKEQYLYCAYIDTKIFLKLALVFFPQDFSSIKT